MQPQPASFEFSRQWVQTDRLVRVKVVLNVVMTLFMQSGGGHCRWVLDRQVTTKTTCLRVCYIRGSAANSAVSAIEAGLRFCSNRDVSTVVLRCPAAGSLFIALCGEACRSGRVFRRILMMSECEEYHSRRSEIDRLSAESAGSYWHRRWHLASKVEKRSTHKLMTLCHQESCVPTHWATILASARAPLG